MRLTTLSFAALAVVTSVFAHAEGPGGLDIAHCAFPDAPTLPDGSTVPEAELATAGADMKAFVANMQTALACLDSVEKSMGASVTPEQRGMLTAIYNNGVDQMNALAAAYNAQVRAFRARDTQGE